MSTFHEGLSLPLSTLEALISQFRERMQSAQGEASALAKKPKRLHPEREERLLSNARF